MTHLFQTHMIEPPESYPMVAQELSVAGKNPRLAASMIRQTRSFQVFWMMIRVCTQSSV